MNNAYIITNEELAKKGLDLNEYALDGAFVYALINMGLDICVTRCCALNDNFKNGEDSIEQALDEDNKLVKAFKKLQFWVIYNLIFTAETSPVEQYIDSIIVFELHWGKINGFQKGLFYKNN